MFIFLLISIAVISQAGVIIDYGYNQLTTAWYDNNSVKILEESSGKRQISSKIIYSCKEQKYYFGENGKQIISSRLTNSISAFHEKQQEIENCTVNTEYASLFGYQLVNIGYKKDVNVTTPLKRLLDEDTKYATHFIVPSSFGPNKLEKIRYMVNGVRFIPKHKLHAAMIMNAVSKNSIDVKNEYLIIEAGSYETQITKIKLQDNEFIIEDSLVVPLRVEELNEKLMPLVGNGRTQLEKQSILQEVEELRIKLSSNKEITTYLDELDTEVTIKREEYNAVIADLIEPLIQKLKEVKEKLDENAMVFLIGGLGYTPIIKENVQSIFGEYSIRINGDEFMMESARLMILLEQMNEPHMKITDLIPYNINLRINGKTESFLKKSHLFGMEFSAQIPKTDLIEFVNDGNEVLRTFKVSMEKEGLMKVKILTLQDGLMDEIDVNSAKFEYEIPFNSTLIDEQTNGFMKEMEEAAFEQAKTYKLANEFYGMMKGLENVFMYESEKFESPGRKLEDLKQRMQWLELSDNLDYKTLETQFEEFKSVFEEPLEYLKQVQKENDELNVLANKTVEILNEMRELNMKQADEYSMRLNDFIQAGVNTSDDRAYLRKMFEHVIKNGEKEIKNKKLDPIRDMAMLILIVVLLIGTVIFVWHLSSKNKKSTKQKKLRIPPKHPKAKKD